MTGEIVRGLGDVAEAASVVSIGFFDGVHRGHQAIIKRAVRRAEDDGVRSVVVTFDRHPMEVVQPGSQPPLLMTLERRARALVEQGVDLVAVLPFDDELRHRSPADFVDHVLVGPLRPRHVIVGTNFRFGHKAAGDVTTLTDIGAARGFTAEGVTLLQLGGTVISSTEIRAAIERGDVARATQLLGRPHGVDGVVVRGNRRGLQLGFPTANLRVSRRVSVPAPGVYTGMFLHADGRQLPCVTNVGFNPTFGGQELRIEAHLLDFSEDLYGVAATVDFRDRIRDERRFAGPDALVEAIRKDIEVARQLLSR